MKLTITYILMPRSRTSGSITPLPHMPSWRPQGQHFFTLLSASFFIGGGGGRGGGGGGGKGGRWGGRESIYHV